MKEIKFGNSIISSEGPCYVIAEIGNNHQGSLETALEMIKVAGQCGVNAVKFQKRNNQALYTKAMYNRPYDNENSYGETYGKHREYLEFGRDEYLALKKCAEANGVDFMCTAFDFESVEFLEDIGITTYKIASGDLTSIPLLTRIAKLGKPMIVSTGASTLDEVRLAYEAIMKYNDKLCLLHCVAGYPADYPQLNLSVIEALKQEFPEAVIGYSGHDNGILAAVVAYMLGATVVEKHFTLNRAWKGTDHKFSLEPEGLRKQVRDLRRVDAAMGNPNRVVYDFEKDARSKMGKAIYAAREISAGETLKWEDLCFKSPAAGLPPYTANEIIGKTAKTRICEEEPISWDKLA